MKQPLRQHLAAACRILSQIMKNTAKYLIEYLKRGQIRPCDLSAADQHEGPRKHPASRKYVTEEGRYRIRPGDAGPEWRAAFDSGLGWRNSLGRTRGGGYDRPRDPHWTARYHQRLRMVTLEGELLSPGGSISRRLVSGITAIFWAAGGRLRSWTEQCAFPEKGHDSHAEPPLRKTDEPRGTNVLRPAE